MPRRLRRRLLTSSRKKSNNNAKSNHETEKEEEKVEIEVSTPRGRLKGALKEALEPGGDESDISVEETPVKRNARYVNKNRRSASSSEEDWHHRKQSPQRYVLKLFDRSVDLSQFDEDSPLYPICRAWIANQPKMNYKKFGKRKYRPPEQLEDSVELPRPLGPPVSRIPKLLPEQETRSKDNINLNYREAPPPLREVLLMEHCSRWAAVRQAWIDQALKVEARYDATQNLLNKLNVSFLKRYRQMLYGMRKLSSRHYS